LNAELVNLRNEYEVRISVSNFNNQVDIKNSGVTHYNGNRTTYNDRNSDVSNTFNSESKINQNLTSPVTKFGVNSGVSSPKEESFIKMVDSKI
jgi:alpha-L-arabinofuranosidase